MGWGRKIKKAVKKATKAIKSVATAPVDAAKSAVNTATSLAKGDVKGAVNGLVGVADAATRVATASSMSLTNKGTLINANLSAGEKVKNTSDAVTGVADDWDGLSAYVADMRARKRRRTRAGTNNTNGSEMTNTLGGSTTLGV